MKSTTTAPAATTASWSHPVRGAWIEIQMRIQMGLAEMVAPREGCVD